MRSDYLFLAEVKSINYLFSPNRTKSRSFMGYNYTINVVSALEPTTLINNVRVITNNLGGINNLSGGTYTFNPPAIGDYVVCGYLQQDLQAPVALGVISNTSRNQMPISLLAGEGTYLLHHESGTWMRIRNVKNQWKGDFSNAGQNITSKSNESEYILHHNDGHEIKITKDTIVINHSIGHQIVLSEDNFNVESSYGHKITIDDEKVKISHAQGQNIELNQDGKILIGEENHEPIIKGKKFDEWLEQLKNALGNCNVMTALGPSGTLSASPGWVNVLNVFQTLKNDLDNEGNTYFSKNNKVS